MSKAQGIINVIKPPGMSSFQVVKQVKKIIACKKAGHTGTLDPAAAGVLPVCIARATKIIPYISDQSKEYIGEITLGQLTDTLDATGQIVEQDNNWQKITEKDIISSLQSYLGEIEQIPPMYSAVHYQGKRLYHLARKGKKVKRQPRQVKIYWLKLLAFSLPKIRIQLRCSKGTYIRSLAVDLGRSLNTGAHLSFLLRTKAGPFKLEQAYTFQELENKELSDYLLPLDFPLVYPQMTVKKKAEKKAYNGQALNKSDFINFLTELSDGQSVLLYDERNNFISINKIDYQAEDGNICKAVRVFSDNI